MRRLLLCTTVLASCGGEPPPTGQAGQGLVPGTHVELGDAQSAFLLQQLDPVMVRAVDDQGAPLAHAPVTVVAPPGAVGRALAPTTDAAGRVLLELRLGRALGAYAFTVTVGSNASVTVDATATEPPRGTLLTLVNARRISGDAGVPGPGSEASLIRPAGVALDADGTVYFSDQGTCRVHALSPDGVVTPVAGTGVCTAGSMLPSVAAQTSLWAPTGLALDRASRRLFIAESRLTPLVGYDLEPGYVRVVHLTTGMMEVYAGGGAHNGPFNPLPGYRPDNCFQTTVNCVDWPGPITSPTAPRNVPLHQPVDLTVGPDGWLYVANTLNSYIFRISPDGSEARFWAGQAYPVATPPAVSLAGLHTAMVILRTAYPGSYSGVRFETDGTAVVAGSTGIAPNVFGPVWSVLRGQPGTFTNFGYSLQLSSVSLALDSQDTLYMAQHELSVIVRQVGGVLELVAGASLLSGIRPAYPGDSGDYIPAAGAAIGMPGQMVFTPEDHLIFADGSNGALRMIW